MKVGKKYSTSYFCNITYVETHGLKESCPWKR